VYQKIPDQVNVVKNQSNKRKPANTSLEVGRWPQLPVPAAGGRDPEGPNQGGAGSAEGFGKQFQETRGSGQPRFLV
jgi:hypothetical protein